jgi:hypothetical protein
MIELLHCILSPTLLTHRSYLCNFTQFFAAKTSHIEIIPVLRHSVPCSPPNTHTNPSKLYYCTQFRAVHTQIIIVLLHSVHCSPHNTHTYLFNCILFLADQPTDTKTYLGYFTQLIPGHINNTVFIHVLLQSVHFSPKTHTLIIPVLLTQFLVAQRKYTQIMHC